MDLQKIVALLRKADTKKRIKFIFLFGSVSQNKQTPLSDIDLAVYYEGSSEERFRFKIQVGGLIPDKVDFHLFQDLPLAVQKEVIAGNVLYYDDYPFLFDQVMKVIKEYSFFEKYYEQYLTSLRREVEA